MANEAGGHRVQRVPPTERRGRVHSSTVTVSVLDASARSAAVLSDADLSIRWFSGTGAGGQHRNRHLNSVEITHLPSGLSRKAQTRSRDTSMRAARAELEKAVADLVDGDARRAVNDRRSAQIGLGMRADKRRTWRFRDDAVCDDVTGRRTTCVRAMRGEVDLLWPEGERPGRAGA